MLFVFVQGFILNAIQIQKLSAVAGKQQQQQNVGVRFVKREANIS